MRQFIYSFIYLSIYLIFIYSFNYFKKKNFYSFIYPFIYSFIYLFIYVQKSKMMIFHQYQKESESTKAVNVWIRNILRHLFWIIKHKAKQKLNMEVTIQQDID